MIRRGTDFTVGVIIRRIGPYHVARLNALSKHSDWRVVGLEVDPADATYEWTTLPEKRGFEYRCFALEGINRRTSQEQAAIFDTLDRGSLDVLAIPGWSDPSALACLRWCCSRDVPAVLMADSTELDQPRTAWKEAIKRRVLRLVSSAFVAGQRQARYLRQLGVPPERIVAGYDVVDNAHFARGAENARARSLYRRHRLGLPASYFLTVARFIPKKNLRTLLEAYARFRASAPNKPWDLVLVGDGPLRSELDDTARSLGIRRNVMFAGFKQYQDLPSYYGLANAFILPSTTDQWGLAVNEAMASGLPVLVSERCGCAPDLVDSGRNGYTFDPSDLDRLIELMVHVASDTCDRKTMGVESRNIIDHWTPETFSRGFARAAQLAHTAPLSRPTLADRALLGALSRRHSMIRRGS